MPTKPTPEPVKLGKHEGREVLVSRIIPKTGSNVMEPAMDLDPIVAKIGDRVGMYIEGEIVDLHFPLVKSTNGVARTHILKVDKGLVVDTAEFADSMAELEKRAEERRDAAQRAEEEAAGIGRLAEPDGTIPDAAKVTDKFPPVKP
jgi:predicted RNase H-like nuclease (RuvC/YqgF family)